MITLIANPESYDGRWGSIGGFLKYEEGKKALLFFTRDDLYYNNMKNSFILNFDPEKFKDVDLSPFNGHNVSLIGYFGNNKLSIA